VELYFIFTFIKTDYSTYKRTKLEDHRTVEKTVFSLLYETLEFYSRVGLLFQSTSTVAKEDQKELSSEPGRSDKRTTLVFFAESLHSLAISFRSRSSLQSLISTLRALFIEKTMDSLPHFDIFNVFTETKLGIVSSWLQ
jgi:hypothetical protein